MKVRYSYTINKQPIYVSSTNGVMRVLLILTRDLESFVYYSDDYTRKVYLNKIINPLDSCPFYLDNFIKIKEDEEFNSILNFIKNNFNYNGEHVQEIITGYDLGGPVIWTP